MILPSNKSTTIFTSSEWYDASARDCAGATLFSEGGSASGEFVSSSEELFIVFFFFVFT